MKYGAVFVEAVQVEQRLRSLSSIKVELLTESMGEIGLQQPISIWSPDLDTAVLVAGLHRLEAAKKLGWDEIDCVYVDMDETTREMWEIAENLHRVDLTKEERDKHIRRYAQLLEIKQEKAKLAHSEPVYSEHGGRGKTGKASVISQQTGVPKSTVNRVLNPQPSTVPNEEAADQEKVYTNLCKWWRKAGDETRVKFKDNWISS